MLAVRNRAIDGKNIKWLGSDKEEAKVPQESPEMRMAMTKTAMKQRHPLPVFTAKIQRHPAKPRGNGKPFAPGQSGNPAGRPVGSRNRLSEAFFRDLCEVWARHGKAAIENVARTNPATFLWLVVAVIPKKERDDQNVDWVMSDRPISNEEWAAKYSEPEGAPDG
jgi:hypothetical protein